MTVSGNTTFDLTRNEIIRLALLECNGTEPDEAVETRQQEDASKFLNMIVKRLSVKHPLFGVIDYTIPLYDRKQSYTIGAGGNRNVNRPVSVTDARRQDSSGNETPIWQMARKDYMDLPLKSSTGLVNQFCYDKQLNLGVLYVWPVSTATSTKLSDGSTDQWTNSGAVPGEYYYTGSDISAEPVYVFANEVELTQGTLGSLANGEYAWGDNDTIGNDTLYVKTAVGDPDAQADGYLKVLVNMPDRIIITANRTLDDFTTSADTPDFPQEALEMLVAVLAAKLSIQYSPQRVQLLKIEADTALIDYFSNDSEDVGFQIQPSFNGSRSQGAMYA
ncbi:MAG: hypothetical protein GY714_18090 [Desulfobacterales bacterium]|nr:hypothetical protein [Desulfobacterales bacterium]